MSECILVGNATFENNYGDLIDSHNHVYRFNRFKTIGYESKVGSKCTHWILNNALTTDSRDYYVKNIHSMNKAYPDLTNTIVITNTTKSVGRLDVIKNNYDNFDYHISDFQLSNKKMSTGILALSYLIDVYDTINLVGFDFGKTNHYWGVDGPSDIPGKHNWNLESEYVSKLVSLGKVNLL
jgi:hypothetical protein